MPKKITLHNKKSVATIGHHQYAMRVILWSVGVTVVLFGVLFGFSVYARGRVPYGTRIGTLSIGGLDFQAARTEVDRAVAAEIDKGLTVSYQSQTFPVPSTVDDPTNPDLATPPVYTYDVDRTMAELASIESRLNPLVRAYYAVFGWHITPIFSVDGEKLDDLLRDTLSEFDSPATNAQLVVGSAEDLSILPETAGQAFNYEDIASRLTERLRTLSVEPVIVNLQADTPVIAKSTGELLLPLAKQIIGSAPFAIVYGDKSWPLTQEQVMTWLEFQVQDGQPTVGLHTEKLAGYVTDIANEVNIPVSEGKFAMTDGKVTSFSPSRDGLEVQIAETVRQINEKIRQVGVKDIDLAVTVTKSQVDMASVNDLGINELIGEGHSNFKGSPSNRRHNIQTGADKLNGILIKPDEEFSLIKTLGAIDASTGYLPELVIKGNKTTPEYGGGLCQIGTTTFRAALDAGLPILERVNHSYRVSYYEPAGTDATIYDPKPDFRFKNDTGHYILFTTEIKGDDLYFRFYGTSDGRKVAQTAPRIYNQKSPPPKKTVETTDLAPGQVKCTEKAHTGADAEFSRTITYADGTTKTDTFKSHYKPWQEVCLVGVAKTTPVTPPSTNTNANTNTAVNTNSAVNTNAPASTNTNTPPVTNETNTATDANSNSTVTNETPAPDVGV